jgi:hypothetical protein
MGDPIPLVPDDSPVPASTAAPSPCPGCGWPTPADAALCTRCGHRVRGQGHVTTKVGRPERVTPVAPSRQVSVGEQTWIDTQRRQLIRAGVYLGFGFCVLSALYIWDNGLEKTLGLYARQGITLAAALVVFTAARFTVIECDAGFTASVVGMAAGLALWDLSQQVLSYALLPVLPWIVGMVVCLGVLAEALDLEITEAAIVAVGLLLLKLVLRWTLFGAFIE